MSNSINITPLRLPRCIRGIDCAGVCTTPSTKEKFGSFYWQADGKRWRQHNNGRYTNAIIPRSSNLAFEK